MNDQLGVALDLQYQGGHIGIFFETDRTGVDKYVHLSDHLSVEIEPHPPRERLSFPINYPGNQDDHRKFLHYRIIKRIAETNAGTIPYSPPYIHDSCFNQEYEWVNTKPGSGLTCATFVLKCFKEIAVDLVAITDWPVADADDMKFAESVIRSMMRRADKCEADGNVGTAKGIREHVEAFSVAINGNWMRVRPSYVAAATDLHSGKPLSHKELTPRANEISQRVSVELLRIANETRP